VTDAKAVIDRYAEWSNYVTGDFTMHAGPTTCIHSNMLREPYVELVADHLRATLANP